MIAQLAFALLCLLAQPTSAPTTAPTTKPVVGIVVDRADVDRLIEPLIDNEYAQSIVVGIVDSSGVRVFGYGKLSANDDRAPDRNTVYEIGSVSKVFTSLLLADIAESSTLGLDDPVQQFLPADVQLAVKGRRNTLRDLATHQSGLPRLPDNIDHANLNDPYATYDVAKLMEFLRTWKPSRAPGERVEYSNLGTGLLGYLLAKNAVKSYEQLLIERICSPLEMSDTTITLNDSQKERLAPGHNGDGQPVANWHFTDAFAGAGAIRSTANDMCKFIIAQFDPPRKSSLGQAIFKTHKPQADIERDRKIGLGWFIDRGGVSVWHNGETGGYHSFVAASPSRRVGVVILSNTATGLIDAIGSQIVRKQLGLPATIIPPLRKPIAMSAEQLDRFVGDYRLGFSLVQIRRAGDQLSAQITGQPAFRIYFDTDKSAFWKVVDAKAVFEFNDDGTVNSFTLHQNGRKSPATRIAVPTQPTTKSR